MFICITWFSICHVNIKHRTSVKQYDSALILFISLAIIKCFDLVRGNIINIQFNTIMSGIVMMNADHHLTYIQFQLLLRMKAISKFCDLGELSHASAEKSLERLLLIHKLLESSEHLIDTTLF